AAPVIADTPAAPPSDSTGGDVRTSPARPYPAPAQGRAPAGASDVPSQHRSTRAGAPAVANPVPAGAAGQALPIRMPDANTKEPPTTTWSAARQNGVSM